MIVFRHEKYRLVSQYLSFLAFQFFPSIAESKTPVLRTGIDDIIGFDGLGFLQICWRYLRIHSKSHHPNILYGLIKKKNLKTPFSGT